MLACFVVCTVVAVVLSTVSFILLEPGAHLSDESRESLGQIVGDDAERSNTRMLLFTAEPPPKVTGLADVLNSLVPSNIFASLAGGDTLKVLIFAMLFGLAVGQVPGQVSGSLTQALDSVYRACQVLTHWVNYLLPPALISMAASQVGEMGLGPMQAMGAFVLAFGAVVALLLLLAGAAMAWRSGCAPGAVAQAMREPFALSIATNNTVSCMPSMIEGLAGRLGFDRSHVELLVPLVASVLRTGAMAYFACATLFVAQLYGRALAPMEVAALIAVCALSGFASSGMAGVITLTLLSTTSGVLGLPFEAAYILFVAVDPLCAMGRTLVTVIGGSAAVALICKKPDAAH